MTTFVNIIHIFVCLVLMFVVLLQQGKGGGMGSAFGGASAQVFGGSGAGNLLTRATAICAGVFMLTSVTLAYLSSSGDRALKAKVVTEQTKKKDRGTVRDKAAAPSASAGASTSPTPAADAQAP
jgi:preprotein translocase subunit SecG